VVEHAMDAVPVLDMKGNPTGMWRFDSTGANKALELIGKHLGMFKDKLQVEVKKTHEEALSELE
jgi:phage terminase small subunit